MLAIIPKPAKLTLLSGCFTLNKQTYLKVDPSNAELIQLTNFLNLTFSNALGYQLNLNNVSSLSKKNNIIQFVLEESSELQGDESYYLEIKPEAILVKARKINGLFYGLMTLRQLLPVEIESKKIIANIEWKIPCLQCEDKPRFSWRGMHLDVSRHFFSVDFIKKYLDLLAMYKFNVFHWHLVDDGGWRIEIEKYPLLTDLTAYRLDNMEVWHPRHLSFQQKDCAQALHGGFYTKQQIVEIIDYAKARHIRVIPEIEMPGHSQAALFAYPQYQCAGAAQSLTEPYLYNHQNVYCLGKKETYHFLKNILDEVFELFPESIVHIGADEVDQRFWNNCPDCANFMKQHQLRNGDDLQSQFVHEMDAFLSQNNKTLMAWDDILLGGHDSPTNATIMSWRGEQWAAKAAKSKNYTVTCPAWQCYFDYSYRAVPLENVYNYDPVPAELNEAEAKYILGAQGNVWTEFMTSESQVEYMALPRMLAVSEVVWTQVENKNLDDFMQRLTISSTRLTLAEYCYCPLELISEKNLTA
ncbi:MAG: beta-N-acetylhexosaminidase [Methylococcales bacterium]|nr:beta-N-acetylhexosaminidase [Methylococcales bacterium]